MSQSKRDYTQFRALLESQETFPLEYTHKFIGKNTMEFLNAVAALEARFPAAQRTAARYSGDRAHLALTYRLTAANADEVIAFLEATYEVVDLKIIL